MTDAPAYKVLTPSQAIIAAHAGVSIEKVRDTVLGIVVRTVHQIDWIEQPSEVRIREYREKSIIEYNIPKA